MENYTGKTSVVELLNSLIDPKTNKIPQNVWEKTLAENEDVRLFVDQFSGGRESVREVIEDFEPTKRKFEEIKKKLDDKNFKLNKSELEKIEKGLYDIK